MSPYKNFLAGIIGNICHYYNEALFGLLAPFISAIFFPNVSITSALIFTYAILPLGLISRPLGAIVFGFIGDRWGRKKAILLSLSGMTIATGAMGLIPSFEKIGIAAPILLATTKMIQSFFSSGEVIGGAIFVLEHFSGKSGSNPLVGKSLISSIYDSSTIFGILLASLAVTLLGCFGTIQTHWRILPLLGVAITIIGLILRKSADEPPNNSPKEKLPTSQFISIIKIYSKQLFAITIVSGFSHINYYIAMTLMNGFLPLVSSITKTKATSINTGLLVLDLFLLPLFGFLAQKYSKEKIMLLGLISGIILYIPLFSLLSGATLITSAIVRTIFVAIGVCFAAPIHHWKQSLVPASHRFTIIALGYTLGAEIIGTPSLAISIWLFKKTKFVISPAVYAVFIGIITLFVLTKITKPKQT